jgi:predicted nucleic acid-binding protein
LIFLDTSALVKAYLTEPGSTTVREIFQRFKGQLCLSDHVAIETLATFAYKLRDGQLNRSSYKRARADFFNDYRREFLRLEVTGEVLETAMRLAHDHRKLGVGSVDLIHIATALHTQAEQARPSITVACADRSMRLLASAAGFQVFDPENDDVARLGAAAN